jgi:hypothetical protein
VLYFIDEIDVNSPWGKIAKSLVHFIDTNWEKLNFSIHDWLEFFNVPRQIRGAYILERAILYRRNVRRNKPG